jgi:hypothetical protein
MVVRATSVGMGVVVAVVFAVSVHAQGGQQTAQQTPPAAPARQGGGGRVGGTPIPGSTPPPALIFKEAWTRAPMSQPITPDNLGNKHLTLHIYGDAAQIRKANHPLDDYTYTGETTTNWAITVSDKDNLWDATSGGRFRLKTQNTGYRFTHVVIKTADGKYYASEEGAGESSVFMETDFVLQDLHWRNLLMTDTPSNASNRRQPDPKRIPIIPTSKATPDLTQIDEIGYSDLMEGGWIPATSRVAAFELYGKVVPRKK